VTIRSKLIVLTSTLLLAILLLGVQSLWCLSVTQAAFETVYNDRLVCLDQLKHVADGYAVQMVGAVDKASSGEISLEEGAKRVHAARVVIAEQWRAYLATYLTEEEKVLAADLEAKMHLADREIDALEAEFQRGTRVTLETFRAWRLFKVIDPVSAGAAELSALQLREATAQLADARAAYAQSRTETLLMLVAALLVGISLLFLVLRPMQQKIAALSNVLIATRRDSNLMLRAHVAGDDELDDIARRYNELIDQQARLLAANQTAAATLSIQLQQLVDASRQMYALAERTSAVSRAMATNVEEVTLSIGMMAETSEHASRLGDATRVKSGRSIERIRASVNRIRELDSTIQALTVRLEALDSTLQQILRDNTSVEHHTLCEISRACRRAAQDTATRVHECIELVGAASESLEAGGSDIDGTTRALTDLSGALVEQRAATTAMAQQAESVACLVEECTNVIASLDAAVQQSHVLATQLANTTAGES